MKINIPNKFKTADFREIVAYVVFFYFLPILGLSTGFFPFWSRHLVLFLVGIILIAYSISKSMKFTDLGFSKENLWPSVFYSLLISGLGILVLFLASKYQIITPKYYDGSIPFFIFYVFISAPIQEFIFRSLMIYELEAYFGRIKRWPRVIVSSLVYSLAHLMYLDLSVLVITFVIGLIWGFLYIKRPNFYGVALSHAILGAYTIYLGFV